MLQFHVETFKKQINKQMNEWTNQPMNQSYYI